MICLDLTRTLARWGQQPTGVDRVEKAYIDAFLSSDSEICAIARVPDGYAAFDRAGCQSIAGGSDLLWRKGQEQPPPQPQFTVGARGLADLVRRFGPRDFVNVSHSNLRPATFGALADAAPDCRKTILIHDVIPLQMPDAHKPGLSHAFEDMLRIVAGQADQVICVSHSAENDLLQTLQAMQVPRLPPTRVAHLGIEIAPVSAPPMPAGGPKEWFVTVGTIEPRKNHALLLDLWTRLPSDFPPLIVAGRRGWAKQTTFDKLDTLVAAGRVIELSGLSDPEVRGLIAGSRALLFPSLAEGFGLPPHEAAAFGVRVVCADLPVYRELLGDIPVYLNGKDRYQWEKAVKNLTQSSDRHSHRTFVAPTWDAHFKVVLSTLS